MRTPAAALCLALALQLLTASEALAKPARKAGKPAAAAPTVVTLQRPGEPEWFGLYVLGQKAGWSKASITKEKRDGKAVLVGRAETSISAQVGPRSVTRSTFDEKVYEAKPAGRLVSFRARRTGDGGDRELVGRCGPKECVVVITGGGERTERRIPHPGETADDADAPRLAAAQRGTVTGWQLEVDRLRARRMEARFLAREKVAAAGVEVPVSIVEERDIGPEGDRLATRVTIADDGRVLEIRIGDIVAKAETETTAHRLDKVDLFGLTRVKLQEPLSQDVPATLRYRIRGLPQAFRTDDPRQRFEAGADGGEAILTVTAAPPAAADPARDPPRGKVAAAHEALLAPTPEIDADAPPIRALARELVGTTRGVYAASRTIADAVHQRLEKTYGASRDRASEVLASGKGDCTEHTLLFTALARAAGIPARQVHGLVFARYDDGVPALYWHAWPEVLAGSEWIALDPTFGQDVADATHIALGRGAQVDTVSLLGSIEVLDVKRVQ
jgi:hypothetical protein